MDSDVFRSIDLCDLGLDPNSPSARQTVDLVGRQSRWDEGNQPFWCGEVEECINGRTVKIGSYFGVDVSSIVRRLVTEQQEDGGWNSSGAMVRDGRHSIRPSTY